MGLLVSGANLLSKPDKAGAQMKTGKSGRARSGSPLFPGLVEALLDLWGMLQSFSKNLLHHGRRRPTALKKALQSLPPEGPAA